MLLKYSGYNRMLWIYYVQGSVTKIIPVYNFWMEQMFDGFYAEKKVFQLQCSTVRQKVLYLLCRSSEFSAREACQIGNGGMQYHPWKGIV